jgi:hypothetical protein
MFQQINGMKKLRDLDATIKRGEKVLQGLEQGLI